MKTYFIGLGGCGLRTVSEIQKRIKNIPEWEKDYEFTYIDTDKNTYNNINEKEIVISSNDFKNMGDTNPAAVYNNIKGKANRSAAESRFMEWVISQEPGHMVLENAPLADGAKAFRNLGRIAIYNKYNDIIPELETKINRFQGSEIDPKTSTRDVDIWVVASSCGGTGSSNLLDILYLINRIANPVVQGNGVPNLKLVLFMPQAFVEKNKGNYNYPLNAYSCLWEINAFRNAFENGNGKSFEMFAVRPTELGKEVLDFPLFKFVIPVDVETNANTKLNVDTNYYPTIAEMIYYLTYGKGAAELCSSLSNDVANMIGENGKTRSLISYGFRAIRKPDKELKDYLKTRGVYEIMKYGLLDKNHLGEVIKEKVRFTNNCILSKLTTLETPTFEDGDTSYDFSSITLEDESLKNQVANFINSNVKYDPTALDADTLKLKLRKLADIEGDMELRSIKGSVFNAITKAIDKGINETIINYGLEFAYDLLNTVDDFYLEPLNRHIKETLIPNLNNVVATNRKACEKYVEKGYRKGKYQEVGNALKKYKEALLNQIVLTISSDIIRDLTEAPNGYLEAVRKGDRTNFAGLLNLKKAVAELCEEYENNYSELAKTFRATKSDAMTIFLPNLADIATGPDNSDWQPNNLFDELYQGSILEQEEFDNGYEKYDVPKRSQATGLGLTSYLTLLDPDINLFTTIIKDKSFNLEMNVEKKIKIQLERIIEKQAESPQTSASDFLSNELKDIFTNTKVLPKSLYKNFDELFNDFKDTSRVPVFFPLKAGETMPNKMRLMFVGNNVDMAGKLGYNEKNPIHKWVEDSTMTDRFMVLRMPIGLTFDMYKYFPEYKNAYENPTLNNQVRNKFYGCHIHQTFNENNNFQEIIIRKRLEDFIHCLFYQHISDILMENDKVAYSKLFGIASEAIKFGDEGTEIEGMSELLSENGIDAGNNDGSSFISVTPDFVNRKTAIKIKTLRFDEKTNLLSINTNDNSGIKDFDENETLSCKIFTDKILTLPSKLFMAAEQIRGLVSRDQNLAESVKRITAEAKKQLTTPTITVDGKKTNQFAALLFVWKKLDKVDDRPIIDIIENIIRNL